MESNEITELDTENPMVPGGDLDEETMEALGEALRDMKSEVNVKIFVRKNCYYCRETIKLIENFVKAAPTVNGKKLLSYEVYDKDANPQEFQKYKVDRTPTVAFLDGRIRYLGIPSGEEIRSLVETIIRISENESGLEEKTKKEIAKLGKPVHIEVVITPSCPYCPYAALLANMFAFESFKQGGSSIRADTVEAYENPDIADKYNVMSVPAIAINGEPAFVGLPYEEDLLRRIVEIIKE
ncbi:MAG: thioredoxin family protein [Fervidicoccaceae archaeon]